MKHATLLLAVVALFAIGGLVMTQNGASGAATNSISCPEGRMQLVQMQGGQFARICTASNEPVYASSNVLTEQIQRGVPRSSINKADRSFQMYCDRYPNACNNE